MKTVGDARRELNAKLMRISSWERFGLVPDSESFEEELIDDSFDKEEVDWE